MSHKQEILLVRHGESLTNQTDTYQAGDQTTGDPLSDPGEVQAQLVAQEFHEYDYKPDIIIASGYQRAWQTAQYIGAVVGAQIIIPVYDADWRIRGLPGDSDGPGDGLSLFRELDLPVELEGRSYDDPGAKAIKRVIHEQRFNKDWRYSNEENLHDIWKRAGKCVEYLANRPEDRVAVVAHGGIIKACLAWIQFNNEKDWTMKQKLQAYQAFTKIAWADNTGIEALFHEHETGKWQWLISYNRHLNTRFGFMNREPEADVDTATD